MYVQIENLILRPHVTICLQDRLRVQTKQVATIMKPDFDTNYFAATSPKLSGEAIGIMIAAGL